MEATLLWTGVLGSFADMRKQLARLAVARASDRLRATFGSHEDAAVRAAWYSNGRMTLEEIQTAYARDPLLAVRELMTNPFVWQSEEQRDFLREIAQAGKGEGRVKTNSGRLFYLHNKEFRQKHPEWFTERRPAMPMRLRRALNVSSWFGWVIAILLVLRMLFHTA